MMAGSEIPSGLKAEVLLDYIPRERRRFEICGSHKRNAYHDILDIASGEDGTCDISIGRDGLYDILPEGLFHPVDRFENIPANEYHERFEEECEAQKTEEAEARHFFSPFDAFLAELGSVAYGFGQKHYSDNDVLCGILCDSMPEIYRNNRFVAKAMPFVPMCSRIRGDRTLLSLMLRKIFYDESLRMDMDCVPELLRDESPRYCSCLDEQPADGEETYLGNEFIEDILTYRIHYWNGDECDSDFLSFVSEIRVFEDFVNDWFSGIESAVRFDVSTDSLPVRLSDDMICNYLNYNTNI